MTRLKGGVRRAWRDERGVTAILTALFITAMMMVSAFAVDFGYIFLQTRKLQGIADIAAMAAATDLTQATTLAQKAVAANGWNGPITVSVVTGSYSPDPTLSSDQRFVAGGSPMNAAQVQLSTSVPTFFAAAVFNTSSVDISRQGVAASAQLAAFSVGSRLASVDGGVANALLTALTGSKVSLSVMDYNNLLSTNVDLFDFMSALRTQANLNAGTFDELLGLNMTTGSALQALSAALSGEGAKNTATVLNQIAAAVASNSTIQLNQLIDIGDYGVQDRVAPGGTSIKVGVMDLVNAVLTQAQQGRQLTLNLGTTIPGVASTTVWLAIGERPNQSPWLTVTDTGTPVLHTAQTRLYVDAQIAPGLGSLKTAGIALVDLPIYVELASADAKLAATSCPATTSARNVDILVQPSVGHVSIASINTAKLNDFTTPLTESPANLVNILLLSVTAQARVDVGGNTTWQTLSFSWSDITNGVVKTVSTTDIAQSIVTSLLGKLTLNIKILGLGLGLGSSAIQSSLASLLGTVAAPLDGVLNNLTGLLGVRLGEADVRVNGLRCNAAALVL